MNDLQQWATRHQVSPTAMSELGAILQGPTPAHSPAPADMSENAVSQRVELGGTVVDGRLWRNNVGAYDERYPPSPGTRWGLFNDSAKMNKKIKSPDRVGPIPVLIQPHHVGRILGVFFGVEVKHGAWKPGEDKKREEAQHRGLQLINSLGGVGLFASHVDHFYTAVHNLRVGI